MARSFVAGKVQPTTVRTEQVRAPSFQSDLTEKSLDAVLENAFKTIEEIRGEASLAELSGNLPKVALSKLAQHVDASAADGMSIGTKLTVDSIVIDGAAIDHSNASTALSFEGVSFLNGAVSSATSIDGSGDLTMGTITMTGFGVAADGATTAKSLDIDNGGFVSSPAVKIDEDATGRAGYVYMVGASGQIASSPDVQWVAAAGGAAAKLVIAGGIQVDGDLEYVNTTDLQVVDKTITLNNGGAAASAGGAGILFEENNVAAGYVQVASDRQTIEIKAPASAFVMDLKSSANATFNLGADFKVSAASEIDQEIKSTASPSWVGLKLTGETRGIYVHVAADNSLDSVSHAGLLSELNDRGLTIAANASDAAMATFNLAQSIKSDADFAVKSLTADSKLSLSVDTVGAESKIFAGAGQDLKLEVASGEVMTLKVGANSLAIGDLGGLPGGQTLTQLLKASVPVKMIEASAADGFTAASAFVFASTSGFAQAPAYHSLYLNGIRLSQADYTMSVGVGGSAGKLVATLSAVGGVNAEFEAGDKLVLEIFAARS